MLLQLLKMVLILLKMVLLLKMAGNDVAAALKKVNAVDEDGAVAAANMAGKGDQKDFIFAKDGVNAAAQDGWQ
jgi:hypothetical protein